MAALTVDRHIPKIQNAEPYMGGGNVIRQTVAATTQIFRGSFVRIDAGGDIVPCASTSTEPCLGIAMENVDNDPGADGDKTCQVLMGAVIQHIVASATKANIGDAVFTSDDQTLLLTATTNEPFGWILGLTDTANECVIQMGWNALTTI